METRIPTMELIRDILETGTAVRVAVTGQSMGRTVRSGDRVTVRRTAVADISLGDLVLYRNHWGAPVLHRVVAARTSGKGRGLYTKGDAREKAEGPIYGQQVLGRVERLEKQGKRPRNLNAMPWRLAARIQGFRHLAICMAGRIRDRLAAVNRSEV